VWGHFGLKTLPTQETSALCVWCQSVSNFCINAEVFNGHFGTSDSLEQKCMRQFGSELKVVSSVASVLRNVDPLYIRYPNGMVVHGKQMTTATCIS